MNKQYACEEDIKSAVDYIKELDHKYNYDFSKDIINFYKYSVFFKKYLRLFNSEPIKSNIKKIRQDNTTNYKFIRSYNIYNEYDYDYGPLFGRVKMPKSGLILEFYEICGNRENIDWILILNVNNKKNLLLHLQYLLKCTFV
jgi:hypothetical protein